jgi:hypothetical protein
VKETPTEAIPTKITTIFTTSLTAAARMTRNALQMSLRKDGQSNQIISQSEPFAALNLKNQHFGRVSDE